MAAKKKKKKYRGFWIFVKVQFVLSLLVLGGLGYYVLGGYASEVSSIHKEADSLVRNSTEETFRRYRTSVVYAAVLIVEAALDTDFSYLDEYGMTLSRLKMYKTNEHAFIRRK